MTKILISTLRGRAKFELSGKLSNLEIDDVELEFKSESTPEGHASLSKLCAYLRYVTTALNSSIMQTSYEEEDERLAQMSAQIKARSDERAGPL
jgi:hypothetical protein